MGVGGVGSTDQKEPWVRIVHRRKKLFGAVLGLTPGSGDHAQWPGVESESATCRARPRPLSRLHPCQGEWRRAAEAGIGACDCKRRQLQWKP